MISIKLPFWLRVVVLLGVICVATGAGLFAYRYFTEPTTFTVAAGSLDGEAVQTMSAVGSYFSETRAPVRLKLIDTGNVIDATKAFTAGNVDLAVVRGDVGDLSHALAVAIVTRAVVVIAAPAGSSIDSVAALKGQTVGVVGGEVNQNVVAALTNEYNLDRMASFKDLTPANAGKAFKNREIGALLVTIPMTEKYLRLFRTVVQPSPKALPVLVPIESAGAIAQAHPAYESFDIPKGTLRGAPPVPEDDLTTLRVAFYLVAQKKLNSNLVTSLTQSLMNARRDLLGKLPMLEQLAPASTDSDAFIPLHPGAAAFYNGTQQSFLDKYSNEIFLAPMILGVLASVAGAAWKFLGLGKKTKEGILDSLYALARKIRVADTDADLFDIEDRIDNILRTQLTKTAAGDEDAIDIGTLNLAAHRLENLIHYRRATLIERRPARDGVRPREGAP